MNCILPRARPVGIIFVLLLIMLNQTTSSNAALQQLEEDEDGNVMKESQLRKKPRQVKVEVEEKQEDEASSSSTFQAHDQYSEGDKDSFQFESQQELQLTKRNLSIFDTAEETDNDESTPVIVGADVNCNDTVAECDIDLEDCVYYVVDDGLVCYLDDEEEEMNDTSTLDYEDNPSSYPDVTYDYEDAKDEEEEKSSKSGKQVGTGAGLADDADESGRKLKRRKYESGSDGFISVITETEREQALQLIDQASEAVESAEDLRVPTREYCQVQLAEVRAEVASK